MKNNALIDSILILLAEYKKEKTNPQPNKSDIDSLHYLVTQSIRQYVIPQENYHLSIDAHKRWCELSKGNIRNYHYRNKVICDNLSSKTSKPVIYDLYIGSSKKGVPTTFHHGKEFLFRQMFH